MIRTTSIFCLLWATLASAQPTNSLPAAVRDALVAKFGTDSTRYLAGSSDLNGDGKPEVVVHIVGPMHCGTGGCPTLVFTPAGQSYRLVTEMSVSRPPVRVSPRSSNGWRNLIVSVSGGGAKGGNAELAFDGRKYPSNPSVAPAKRVTDLSGATVLIPEFQSFEDTIELKAGAAAPAAPAAAAAAPAAAPAAASRGAVSASFDCAKATQPVEKLICSDAGLAELDKKLAGVYATGIKRWTADGVADAERAAQRAWMTARNKCGTSRDCVESSYRQRIVAVQIRSGQVEAPKAVTFSCEGKPGVPFQAAFYNNTDPRSVALTLQPKQAIAFAVPAASGAKYAAPDVEFWEHQGEATVKWFGESLKCQPLKR